MTELAVTHRRGEREERAEVSLKNRHAAARRGARRRQTYQPTWPGERATPGVHVILAADAAARLGYWLYAASSPLRRWRHYRPCKTVL